MTVLPEAEPDIVIRLLMPTDAANEQAFVSGQTRESSYRRFRHAITDLTPDMLRRLLDKDGEQQLACIAITGSGGAEQEVGVARYTVDPGECIADFAIVVSDEWQGRGVGARLMQNLIDHARRRGLRQLRGYVLAANEEMLDLMRRQGFQLLRDADEPGVLIAILTLKGD